MKSPQEIILGDILDRMITEPGANFSNYEILKTIKDCFTIQRIQKEIDDSTLPIMGPDLKKLQELNTILCTYSHILNKKPSEWK